MKHTYNLEEVEGVPLILGSTAVVKKNIHKYSAMIPGDDGTLEIQREVLHYSYTLQV